MYTVANSCVFCKILPILSLVGESFVLVASSLLLPSRTPLLIKKPVTSVSKIAAVEDSPAQMVTLQKIQFPRLRYDDECEEDRTLEIEVRDVPAVAHPMSTSDLQGDSNCNSGAFVCQGGGSSFRRAAAEGEPGDFKDLENGESAENMQDKAHRFRFSPQKTRNLLVVSYLAT